MTNAEQAHRPLIVPDGVEVLPDTFWGLRGLPRGSGGGYWSPVGVRWETGTPIKSWYDHFHKTEQEHWHVNEDDLRECQRLTGTEVGYAD